MPACLQPGLCAVTQQESAHQLPFICSQALNKKCIKKKNKVGRSKNKIRYSFHI